MRHLESISSFYGVNSNVNDYIDLINKEYNLKTLIDRAKRNSKRYEVTPNDLSVIYFNVYGKYPGHKSDDHLLICKFYLNEIDFDKLNDDVLRKKDGCQIISYDKTYGGLKANSPKGMGDIDIYLNRPASFAIMTMQFFFDEKDPEDLIKESLHFLVNMGFELSINKFRLVQYLLSKEIKI